ncbi:MAG: hypothetical protein ACKPJ4_14935, partial [Dolichospermum sp.]
EISCTAFNLYDYSGQDARTTISSHIRIVQFSCVTTYSNFLVNEPEFFVSRQGAKTQRQK